VYFHDNARFFLRYAQDRLRLLSRNSISNSFQLSSLGQSDQKAF